MSTDIRRRAGADGSTVSINAGNTGGSHAHTNGTDTNKKRAEDALKDIYKAKAGIIPGHICREGHIGIVSKSGTLTYEAIHQLSRMGLGQTTCIGIGGDPLIGTTHIDALGLFQNDPDTDAVIMIGEIGGPDEADAARWCQANMKKPVVGFIAGVTAPPGKRMGHAGALISGGADTADAKLAIMEECGFKVTRNPSEMGKLLKALL